MSRLRSAYQYIGPSIVSDSKAYMYTSYQGIDFLNSYVASREHHSLLYEHKFIEVSARYLAGEEISQADKIPNWITRIDNLLSSPVKKRIAYLHKEYTQDCTVSGSEFKEAVSLVNSETVLFAATKTIVEGEAVSNQDYNAQIMGFLRRFEVNKKLFSIYTSGMKPGSDEPASMATYALLSIALMTKYHETHDLKLLNTVLKLNDFLCSHYEMIEALPDMIYVILSVQGEVACIKSLLAEHLIEL